MNHDDLPDKAGRVDDADDGTMTHREVAQYLGIGRARVFYHEQQALKSIRQSLQQRGVASAFDLETIPVLDLPSHSQGSAVAQSRFSTLHGWLKVSRIVSVNNGCTEGVEIAQAYKLLKGSHTKLLRPPVHVTTRQGTLTPYRVEAADWVNGAFHVRCWPNASAPRTVAQLAGFACTAIVESIFDHDEAGEFDVPLLVCIVVSARETEGLTL